MSVSTRKSITKMIKEDYLRLNNKFLNQVVEKIEEQPDKGEVLWDLYTSLNITWAKYIMKQ